MRNPIPLLFLALAPALTACNASHTGKPAPPLGNGTWVAPAGVEAQAPVEDWRLVAFFSPT